MSVEQPIIKDINKIFQGTLLGKGKVEKSVRMNLFGNQDLSSARKEYLSHIKRADEDFDSMDPDNLALAISIQTKAIALSKKEKGQTEEDPDKKALRDEIKKEEGFCKKLFDYTQDKTHLDKVNQALAILAEEINDHLRANRGIELKNGISDPNLLKKKQIRLVEANKNVDIKERTKMDEKEKAKLREYLATKELKFRTEESIEVQPEEETVDSDDDAKPSMLEKIKGIQIKRSTLFGIADVTVGLGSAAVGAAVATKILEKSALEGIAAGSVIWLAANVAIIGAGALYARHLDNQGKKVLKEMPENDALFSDRISSRNRKALSDDELTELEAANKLATDYLKKYMSKYHLFISHETVGSDGNNRELDESLQKINEMLTKPSPPPETMLITCVAGDGDFYGYHYLANVKRGERNCVLSAMVMFPEEPTGVAFGPGFNSDIFLGKLGLMAFGGTIKNTETRSLIIEEASIKSS